MSTPEERHQAKQNADEAFDHAKEVAARGVSIAARWRQSKEDNNFRAMLRQIGRGTADAS